MPACTPPHLFCLAMTEFFLPFSHFHRGIFPTMSEFFPIPTPSAGKIPSLLMEGIPAYLMKKKPLWVAVKIFL
jgi:hypothetical protein